ncbi:alpha/beta hydrolase [Actinoplanes sp. LDG1-06]|uniref:Alpha/beta hydrolase n=1 Tax=Paractinoplanes ovalisporus TaxID=2810368 RepID=A0ABS2A9D0_9ACTN|nr:alpha/beta hydrolase [Actinoplanes ovalisporus]MBM2615859.1 alpha/beta hydrolase [Actinoplanes ovalisporus]
MAVPTERGARRFLILHGWQNRQPEEHWQHRLCKRLTERGHDVSYPALPEPDFPALKEWTGAIEEELVRGRGDELVVIAHSLACIAWIHLPQLARRFHPPVSRLLFVAPPSPAFLAKTPELREFQFAEGADRLVKDTTVAPPRLACSTGDPYCEPPANQLYDAVFDVDLIDGAGHFDLEGAGYGEWPSVLAWCENGTVRLTGR